jgi:hypothetical protein
MIGFPFSFEAAFEVLAKGVRSAQSSNGYHNTQCNYFATLRRQP